MKNEKIGCVILNFNDAQRSLDLANHLGKCTSIEKIIIVDNCSLDDSISYLKKNYRNQKIEIIESPKNGGFAFGNNYGLKYLNTKYNFKYSLCINTDIFVEEKTIQSLIDIMDKKQDLGAISCRMLGPDKKEQKSWWMYSTFFEFCFGNFHLIAKKNYSKYVHYKYNDKFKYVDCIRGSLMLFRNEALIKCDYFDENTFLYGVETIISKRLQKVGYKIGIDCESFYIHNHKVDKKINKKSWKMIRISRNYYLRNYFGYGFIRLSIIKCFNFLGYVELFGINLLKQILGRK